MKKKDPYLSELDALGDLPENEPTDLHLDLTPPPSEEPPPVDDKPNEKSLALAGDVPVQLIVVLGKKGVTVKDLADLRSGQVIDFEKGPTETVDLVASGHIIASGELVEIDGKLGVRVLKILK